MRTPHRELAPALTLSENLWTDKIENWKNLEFPEFLEGNRPHHRKEDASEPPCGYFQNFWTVSLGDMHFCQNYQNLDGKIASDNFCENFAYQIWAVDGGDSIRGEGSPEKSYSVPYFQENPCHWSNFESQTLKIFVTKGRHGKNILRHGKCSWALALPPQKFGASLDFIGLGHRISPAPPNLVDFDKCPLTQIEGSEPKNSSQTLIWEYSRCRIGRETAPIPPGSSEMTCTL